MFWRRLFQSRADQSPFSERKIDHAFVRGKFAGLESQPGTPADAPRKSAIIQYPRPPRSVERDARCFVIAAEQRGDMADALDLRRRGRRADLQDHAVAGRAIFGIDADLDQFVVVEGDLDFLHDRIGQAIVADDDDRFARVGEGLELALLRICKAEHEEGPDMAKDSGSVTAGKGLTVAPSPLNEVKLDLGIILAVGVLLLLVQGRVVNGLFLQLLLLASYGLLGMGWILIRVRQVLARFEREQCDRHGA